MVGCKFHSHEITPGPQLKLSLYASKQDINDDDDNNNRVVAKCSKSGTKLNSPIE